MRDFKNYMNEFVGQYQKFSQQKTVVRGQVKLLEGKNCRPTGQTALARNIKATWRDSSGDTKKVVKKKCSPRSRKAIMSHFARFCTIYINIGINVEFVSLRTAA